LSEKKITHYLMDVVDD
jgi:hypothetical protein